MPDIIDASLRHLDALRSRFCVSGFQTVYVGGGTPSALDHRLLGSYLQALRRAAGKPLTEFTVEANPQDLDMDFLSMLSDLGVNRLSLGVQSLEEKPRLHVLRRGSLVQVHTALALIAGHWKGRWSCDLMYGLPGQSAEGIRADAAFLTRLGAGHLSMYELTLCEDTVLGKAVATGALRLPEADEAHEQYRAAKSAIEAAGLQRYEVSNWAIPGQESEHNSAYWSMAGWLGIGPSASATVRYPYGFLRMDAQADIASYCRDPLAATSETQVPGATAGFEIVMMGLRTRMGFQFSELASLAGHSRAEAVRATLAGFPQHVLVDDTRAYPTDVGMDMLNPVLLACLETLSGEA